MEESKIRELEAMSRRIHVGILQTGYKAGKKGAHFGGCLSMAEMLAVLYTDFCAIDTANLEARDRVVLSKGHAALALYCALREKGLMTDEELSTFEQDATLFAAHSKRFIDKGLEFAGGSLGLGIAHAVGVAYSCKLKLLGCKVYAILGDGELNEGIVWETLLFAAHKRLDNLILIIDHNHLQADGNIEDVIDTAPLESKFLSLGFAVSTVDGHSVEQLHEAFSQAASVGRPSAIIAETVKGKGVSFMENKHKWHHGALTEQKYKKAMSELEASCGKEGSK